MFTDPIVSLRGLLALVMFVFTVWAIVDAVTRPKDAFVAAGKLTKPAWLVILVLALILGGGIGLFGLAAIVATIVYFVDVRPALREVGRGGTQGPYGPWR